MKKRYRVSLGVSSETKKITISTEEMGYNLEDWSKLTKEEQNGEIQKYVDGFDQPYWVVESKFEID